MKCFVPTLHLTDHPALSSLILNTYHVDDVIEEAVCFEKDAVPIMSLKPSIVQVQIHSALLFLHSFYTAKESERSQDCYLDTI